MLRYAAGADRTVAAAKRHNHTWGFVMSALSAASILILREHSGTTFVDLLIAANLASIAIRTGYAAMRLVPEGLAVATLLPRSGEGSRTGGALIVETYRMSRCPWAEGPEEDRYWPYGVFGAERQRPSCRRVADAAEKMLQELERTGVDVETTLRKIAHLTGDQGRECCLAHRTGRLDIEVGTLQDIDEKTLKAIGPIALAEDPALRGSVSVHAGSESLRALLKELSHGGRQRQAVVGRLAENWQQGLNLLRRTAEELTV